MDKVVKDRFDEYPDNARVRLEELRNLVFQVASELELGEVDETLKWGEPSYSVKTGSPLRMDWKLKSPNSYYLFFNCQTKLIDTFRELYSDELVFQGNRAIVLSLSKPLPETVIKSCLELALTYHQRKNLPLLGV
ncbi:hypothetical protein CGI03_23915 [Vibrio parahaemolyticus]|jgi:hypothetical protein|uniref:DUF1801 domain-containing protein n=1 Tax=Vibrio parahaemolyticus TaxID=670 RepID=UPI001121102F|nr:DUF1801 domain-containing protein [Vibrio parahaemolyticus]EHH2421960.1 DUF1801 domain-containing protein [Vibrio parahaemolyticus]EIO4088741.1 DUF1801 domain-containing protein [Vibrio parahaemolyticus]MBE3714140.1 DUF1801 domain-containing protein [Vibrio parahaemolyticus]MBE4127305.1 DUF1801 domain-containing protein [Vibrio parahaemolyticus]TOH53176.1 hypothetical protein CGI79_22525 [Vibrio parahaemolyticus]